MKSIYLSIMCFAGLLCLSAPVNALTGTAEGHISNVYIYGDGRVLVTGLVFSGATCEVNGGFWVPPEHRQYQRLLALILSAQASGATIAVVAKTDNCWYPEITEGSETYVIVRSQ